MKRHPALVPLSHDHHDGLVLAQRLRLGRSKAPRARWPEDRGGQRDRVVEFYEAHLRPHFRAEEEVVFPLAESALSEGPELCGRLREEHRRMEAMVGNLKSLAGDKLEKALLEFADLLRDHIRLEEGELFESLQSAVPQGGLEKCGKRLSAMRERQGECR